MAQGNTFTVQGVISTLVADTFAQLALPTGLTGNDTTAFRIKQYQFEHPQLANINAVKSEVQLTRGSKLSMANFLDTSLLVKDARIVALVTSGMYLQDLIKDVSPQGDIIIVEQQIYIGYKTTAQGATASLGYKLVFEEIKITADQRIAILAQRLP